MDTSWDRLIRPAEDLALQLSGYGLQRMSARVLAVLLFNPVDTITAGEMADLLAASPGTISTTIRSLERTGLVERVPSRSRREHYRFPDDGWVRLMSSQNEVLSLMSTAARRGLAEVPPDSPPGHRLTQMAEVYEQLGRVLPQILGELAISSSQRRHRG